MIWSFLLAFGSMFGMWLVPKRPKWGWGWSLGMEVPWTIWGVWLGQWGFVMLSFMFAGIYAKNLRSAILEDRPPKKPTLYSCHCGCGRLFTKIRGWDGMHDYGVPYYGDNTPGGKVVK